MERMHLRILGALALLVGAALLAPASRVAAHAGYDRSVPAKDEVVPSPPSRVDAYFKQDIFRQAGSFYLRVYADDNSTQVSEGDGTLDDSDRRHMFTALPPDLPNGRYIVHWATLSDEDGEADEGAFCFYSAVQPTAEQQAECASFAPEATPTAAATPTQAAATQAPTVTTRGNTGGGDDGGSSSGVIIGVIAGVVVVVLVVGGGALWLRSRRA